MSKYYAIFQLLCVMILVNLLDAQIPRIISYQGILSDDAGRPAADGEYKMTFRLYDAAGREKAIWEETQSIAVTSGVFNAGLGSVNPLELPFDGTYWLGIAIDGGDELQPRTELTASAYSLNTLQVKGSTNIFAGSGNVGIGTTRPQEKLEVAGTIHATDGGFKFPDGTLQTTAFDSGDNLGNHTAIRDLDLNGHTILNGAFANDQNLSMQTGVNMVVVAGANMSVQSGAGLAMASGTIMNMQSGSELGLAAGKDLNLQSDTNIGIASGQNMSVAAGQSLVIDVADQITFKCGTATITMKKNGDILITGEDIGIKAAGTITLKGKLIQEN